MHYPIAGVFFYWAWGKEYALTDVIPQAVLTFVIAMLAGWLFMKYWDAPIRKRLSAKYLAKK